MFRYRMLNKLKSKTFTQLAALAVICATALVFLSPLPPSAQSSKIEKNNSEIDKLREKADKIAQENAAREKKIAAMQDDVEQSEAFIGEVETQIGQIEAEIAAYKELIAAKEGEIEATRVEIERKEREIQNAEDRITQRQEEVTRLDAENQENIDKFGELIAQMYMSSESEAISLLTGSKSLYDVLVRTEMIRNIGKKNTEMLEELLVAIETQQTAITELERDISSHEEEKAVYETQRAAFELELELLYKEKDVVAAEVNNRYNALYDLASERDELKSQVNSISGQIDKSVAEIENIQKRVAEMEAENKRIESMLRTQQEKAQNPVYSASGFIWPLDSGYPITGNFGWDSWRNGPHTGVDFGSGGIGGSNIYAVQSGTVLKTTEGGGWAGGYGNHVIIDHGDGVATLYAHMLTGSVAVSAGQFVEQGTVLGRVGTTGFSTGNHLHFEVRINGTAVDPRGYL